MAQPPEGHAVAMSAPFEWDESLTVGRYANISYIARTRYDVTLDFGFRTVARIDAETVQPRNVHAARIVLSLPAARELRDLLIKNIPDEDATEANPINEAS